MGQFSLAELFGVTIRESATDGSDFTDPPTDYRRLFLGEDGLLHLKDSAGTVTDIGGGSSDLDAIVTASSGQDIADALSGAASPAAGNVFATMADVGSVSEITAIPTAETDAALVLAPDGAGGVEFRAEAGGSGGGLLGVTAYNGTLTPSTASGTFVDVDATHFSVTFTAPASGNVLVVMSAPCAMAGGGYQLWSVREGTTDLSTGSVALVGTASVVMCHVRLLISGIAAGSHTYKWAWRTGGAGTANMFIDPVDGYGVIEVWAAP